MHFVIKTLITISSESCLPQNMLSVLYCIKMWCMLNTPSRSTNHCALSFLTRTNHTLVSSCRQISKTPIHGFIWSPVGSIRIRMHLPCWFIQSQIFFNWNRKLVWPQLGLIFEMKFFELKKEDVCRVLICQAWPQFGMSLSLSSM